MRILLQIICILISLNSYAEEATYGPTKTGEAVWHIAKKISPPSASVSIYQVILALQKLNPNAFKLACNINSLKAGVSLQLPKIEEIQTVTYYEAQQEYNRQNTEWKNRYESPIECPTPIIEIQTIEELVVLEIHSNTTNSHTENKFELKLSIIMLFLLVIFLIIILLWFQLKKIINKKKLADDLRSEYIDEISWQPTKQFEKSNS